MAQLFKNAARSALQASITNVATSLTVAAADADLFGIATTGTNPVPTTGLDYFKAVLEDASHNKEIIYVRSRAAGVAIFSNILRGQEGTVARAYAAGDVVGLRITAQDILNPVELAANATATGKSVLNAADAAAARTAIAAAASGANTDITSLAGTTSINGVKPLHLNDIVNGDFRVALAGTSFAAPANGAYDLDGWVNGNSSAAVFTVAQVAGSTTGRLSRQVTITTADAAVAAGDFVVDDTRIEGYNVEKYVGNTFTISFRAKVPVVGIHCVSLANSGGDRSYVKEINFPTANVYQDCSFTVVGGLPTAGTWNYTNGQGLVIRFAHMAGATFQTTPDAWNVGNFVGTTNQVNDAATIGNVWALEKVTLNLGTVAAVGETSYEQELIRCQRYFEILEGTVTSGYPVFFHRQFKVRKRATTTLALISGSTSGATFDSNSFDSLRCPAGTAAGGTTDFALSASARL